MPTTGSSGHVQPRSQLQHQSQRQPRSQPHRQPRSQLQGFQEPGVEGLLGLTWKPRDVESFLGLLLPRRASSSFLGLLLPRRASSSFLGLLRDSTEGFLAPTNADEYILCWAIQAQPRA